MLVAVVWRGGGGRRRGCILLLLGLRVVVMLLGRGIARRAVARAFGIVCEARLCRRGLYVHFQVMVPSK